MCRPWDESHGRCAGELDEAQRGRVAESGESSRRCFSELQRGNTASVAGFFRSSSSNRF